MFAELELLNGDVSNYSTVTLKDNPFYEQIRIKSETYLNSILKTEYGNESVDWLNEEGEAGLPYDFIVRAGEAEKYFIDCKGTDSSKTTFYMSSNEWGFFLANKSSYQIYRVFNTKGIPRFVKIQNLFESISNGEVVPCSNENEILSKRTVALTINSA